MRGYYLLLFALLTLGSCSESGRTLVVSNPSSVDREGEIIEIECDDAENIVVFDSVGAEVSSQVTYDGKLIFPVNVDAGTEVSYRLRRGVKSPLDTIALGAMYPLPQRDLAWENDKIGFRVYCADAIRGSHLYGLDIFTKKGDKPVLRELYDMQCDPKTWEVIRRLRDEGKSQEAALMANANSYHIDHGKGMDYYTVGPTMGCGTATLCTDDGVQHYPTYYTNYKILDRGGLRTTIMAEYDPVDIDGDMVVERRTYTLDAGSHFNRIEVEYLNLSKPTKVIAGVVLRDEGEFLCSGRNYVAYAEPKNIYEWQSYTAVIFDDAMTPYLDLFDAERRSQHGGAFGHTQAEGVYMPGEPLVYYAGAGWNRWGFETPRDWFEYVDHQSKALTTPLTYEFK